MAGSFQLLRTRSVLTDPSGETRDRRRQQAWLDRLRDAHLIAHRERPPRILRGGVRRQRYRRDESAAFRPTRPHLSHQLVAVLARHPDVRHLRLSSLEQPRQGQQRQATLATTVEEFCRNISATLDNPSFETKQKILRLVVERVEFVEDQITIKHVIPISDVRLRRDQLSNSTPISCELLSWPGKCEPEC
jgi:hypothetical protein